MVIPTAVSSKAEFMNRLIISVSLSAIHLAKNRCIPLDTPTAAMAVNIVAIEITTDADPITEGSVTFDSISQYRNPENIMVIASKYRYATPFPTLTLSTASFKVL
jgi:hypothetical protein